MTITFCLVPFIPREVRRECPGFNLVLYSILKYDNKLSNMKHYSCPQPTSYNVTIWSVIFSVKETISPFLSFLYCGVTGSKCIKF